MLNNILQYLEATAPRVPDKTAFSTGTEGLTFSELYTHARSIGAGLLREGYCGEPVAVLMDKHPHTIATFFGVLYAGCFYAALDGDMPPARMGLILDTLKPRVLIFDQKNQKTVQKLLDNGLFGGIVLPWEDLCHHEGQVLTDADEEALTAVRDRQIDTDPIYVVFTSGSTGVPKGVAACHRSVILREAGGVASNFAGEPLGFSAPSSCVFGSRISHGVALEVCLKYAAVTENPL